jgi:hypothetical protein
VVSNISSTAPSANNDGTISAVVQEIQPLPHAGALLRLWLPLDHQAGGGFGRFFLARCSEDSNFARQNDWSIYARRVLMCSSLPSPLPDQPGSLWEFQLPPDGDPGYTWLKSRPAGTTVNLLGPFGQPFELAAHTRTLLILTDAQSLPKTLPAAHTMLDRGGRVTMLVRGEADEAASLLPLVPIPVEVRTIPPENWLTHLAEPVRWADQLCAALPNSDYAILAHHIRTLRFQLDNAFAHVLVTSDILCATGACLACVVSTRDGSYTRACIHGPVLPLATLAH